MDKEKKWFYGLLLIAVIVLHLNFVLPKAITGFYYGDEVEFVLCVESFIEEGYPHYNHGQTGIPEPCTAHPPLYIVLLGFFMLLLGKNPFSFRAVSIIFNVLTIVLVYSITITLLENNKNRRWFGILAAGLYALNPLTIQSSIILDIDGGLLNFLMALFLFLYIKEVKYFYLAIPLFFIFWSKFTGAIILFGSFFLFFLINKKWKEIAKFFIMFLTAGLAFLYSFFIYCQYLIPFDGGFEKAFGHNSIFRYIKFIINDPLVWSAKALWILRIFIYFATPFFILLFVYCFILLITKELGEKKQSKILLIGILALIIPVFFAITGSTGWNFPKFYVLSLPYMSIVSSFILVKVHEKRDWRIIDRKFIFIMLITSILIVCYFLIFLKDPLIPEISGMSRTISFGYAARKIIPRFLMYFLVPSALSSALIYKLPRGKKMIYCLLYLSLLMSIYINLIQVSADYSTHNLYGNSGLEEVLDFINNSSIQAANIAAYSHIGYYTNFEKFLDVMFVYDSPELFKKLVVDNKKIEWLIILDKDIARIGDGGMKYFELEKKIRDYFIYKKK